MAQQGLSHMATDYYYYYYYYYYYFYYYLILLPTITHTYYLLPNTCY